MMMLAAGWGPDQWPSLRALWSQESGWDANAVNQSSGVWDSAGASAPPSVQSRRRPGADRVGPGYIRGRYRLPTAAEAHERATTGIARAASSAASRVREGRRSRRPRHQLQRRGGSATIVSRLTALAQSIGADHLRDQRVRTPQHSVAVGGSGDDRTLMVQRPTSASTRSDSGQRRAGQQRGACEVRPRPPISWRHRDRDHIRLPARWRRRTARSTAATKGTPKKAKKFVPSKMPKLTLPRNLAKVPTARPRRSPRCSASSTTSSTPTSAPPPRCRTSIDATSSIDDQRVSGIPDREPQHGYEHRPDRVHRPRHGRDDAQHRPGVRRTCASPSCSNS